MQTIHTTSSARQQRYAKRPSRLAASYKTWRRRLVIFSNLSASSPNESYSSRFSGSARISNACDNFLDFSAASGEEGSLSKGGAEIGQSLCQSIVNAGTESKHTGVEFEGELAVGRLDLSLGSVSRDTQSVVELGILDHGGDRELFESPCSMGRENKHSRGMGSKKEQSQTTKEEIQTRSGRNNYLSSLSKDKKLVFPGSAELVCHKFETDVVSFMQAI